MAVYRSDQLRNIETSITQYLNPVVGLGTYSGRGYDPSSVYDIVKGRERFEYYLKRVGLEVKDGNIVPMRGYEDKLPAEWALRPATKQLVEDYSTHKLPENIDIYGSRPTEATFKQLADAGYAQEDIGAFREKAQQAGDDLAIKSANGEKLNYSEQKYLEGMNNNISLMQPTTSVDELKTRIEGGETINTSGTAVPMSEQPTSNFVVAKEYQNLPFDERKRLEEQGVDLSKPSTAQTTTPTTTDTTATQAITQPTTQPATTQPTTATQPQTMDEAFSQYVQPNANDTVAGLNLFGGTGTQPTTQPTTQTGTQATQQQNPAVQQALADPMIQQLKNALDTNTSWVSNQQLTAPQRSAVEQQLNSALGKYGIDMNSMNTGAQTTGSTGSVSLWDNAAGDQAAQKILDQYLSSGQIDQGTYSLFKQAVGMWDPGSEINTQAIMDTFGKITQSTIDPYFREQAAIFVDDLQANLGTLGQARGQELQTQGVQQEENLRQTRAGLEASGMTFTGEAGRLLGSQSAYRQDPNQPGIVPVQKFGEGLVEQQNKLMGTSSEARYLENLRQLSRQAETQLGSDAAKTLIPGAETIGGVTGSMQRERNKAQASTLTSLYNQEQNNISARQSLEVV